MTDFRALCAKMAEDIRYLLECLRSPDDGHDPICLSECESDYQEARTALAQPTPPAEGEVGDEELPPRVGHILRLAEIIRAVDGNHDKGAAALAEAILSHPDICSAGLAADLLEQHHPAPVPVAERLRYLQAGIKYGYQAGHEDTVEACFGDSSSFAEEMAPEILAEIESDALAQPAPPAEGKVGELVAKLRRLAPQNPLGSADPTLTRAADLLEQRHPAPVPVSERLPGMEDCDAEGCIWLWDTDRRWVRQRREAASSNTWVGSSWLPGYALPLPAGEVEP